MNNIKLIILVSILLSGCTEPAPTPTQVAEHYWQAIQDGDTESAKKYITNNSQQYLGTHQKFLETTDIENFVVDNSRTDITTVINPEAKTPGDEIIFDTRLVLEDGQWKVDLSNTTIPQTHIKEKEQKALAEELSKSMEKSVDSMEEAIGESMQMLNEALREGSQEMGKSMIEAMDELNEHMQESIDKMKERRHKKQIKPQGSSDEGLI